MTHTAIASIGEQVSVQPGSVVSKVVHDRDGLNVTAFAIDAGQALTEHSASRRAVVQVVSGRLRFTVDGEDLDAGPGFWLHMPAGTPHALTAVEPTVMLLTLLTA